jgi:hypothetical protein
MEYRSVDEHRPIRRASILLTRQVLEIERDHLTTKRRQSAVHRAPSLLRSFGLSNRRVTNRKPGTGYIQNV